MPEHMHFGKMVPRKLVSRLIPLIIILISLQMLCVSADVSYGYTDASYSPYEFMWGGEARGCMVLFNTGGSLKSISLYVKSFPDVSGVSVKAAIYDNAGSNNEGRTGLPGNLVDHTGSYLIPSGFEGWIEIPVVRGASVEPGEYWLTFLGNGYYYTKAHYTSMTGQDARIKFDDDWPDPMYVNQGVKYEDYLIYATLNEQADVPKSLVDVCVFLDGESVVCDVVIEGYGVVSAPGCIELEEGSYVASCTMNGETKVTSFDVAPGKSVSVSFAFVSPASSTGEVDFNVYVDGLLMSHDVEIMEYGVVSAPTTLELDEGVYTISCTYLDVTKKLTVLVAEGSCQSIDFCFHDPEAVDEEVTLLREILVILKAIASFLGVPV